MTEQATPPWMKAGITEAQWNAMAAKVRSERNGHPDDEPPLETAYVTSRDEYLDLLRTRSLGLDAIKKLPRPAPLIEELLDLNTLAEMWGPPGKGKSLLALDLGMHVAHSLPWLGHATTGGPVIYVAAEGAAGTGDRVTAWQEHHAERIRRNPYRVSFVPFATNLASLAWAEAIGEYAVEMGAVLIIFDTRARCTLGVEENSAREMGQIIAHLDTIRTISEACGLLISHSDATGSKSRGSTAIAGAIDTELSFVRDRDTATLTVVKQKNRQDGHQWNFKITGAASSVVLAYVAATDHDEAMSTMTELRTIHEATNNEVAAGTWKAACAVTPRTFYNHVRWLKDNGWIASPRKGYWQPAELALVPDNPGEDF